MKKYYLSYEVDGMHLEEYDTENGVREFCGCTLIYNSRLSVNRLYNSIREAIEDLHGYRKPVIYHGENINIWQPDLFISVNTHTGEMWRDYHFDDTKLKQYEAI